MGLDSLLASLNRDVPAVPAVQASRTNGFARNVNQIADVPAVPMSVSPATTGTAGTASKMMTFQRKPLQHKGGTSGTSGTSENFEVQSEATEVAANAEPIDREAWEERAAIAEYDGGVSRGDAEVLAWVEDDRRRCRQCINLRGAACSIAKPGGLVSASKGYRPANLPMRCEGYSPSLRDADQRTGAERWPGLSEGRRAA